MLAPGDLLVALDVVDDAGVGNFPFGVALNPRTSTVYVVNFQDGTVSVLTSRSS